MLQRAPTGGIAWKNRLVQHFRHRARRIQWPQRWGKAAPEVAQPIPIGLLGLEAPTLWVRRDDHSQTLALDMADCVDQQGSIGRGGYHVRIDREPDEVKAGGTQIGQRLIAHVMGQRGGLTGGGKSKPTRYIHPARQHRGRRLLGLVGATCHRPQEEQRQEPDSTYTVTFTELGT